MPQISARELALQVLRAVEEDGAYANLALNQVLERYRPGKLDRAFATELTYGTLRTRNTLDWVLAQFIKKPLKSQTVILRNILRLGVYQLIFMSRVPPSAACNEGAEMARRHGHAGSVKFVNGVLRNVSRQIKEIKFPEMADDPVAHISLRYSHPAWLVEGWLARFGQEETISLCRANNEPAPNTVRTNNLKLTRAELANRLREDGLTVRETAYAPEGLNIEDFFSLNSLTAFKEGLFQIQDESSMLAGRALMPRPGARVLDACGAPGGKTTHLAELMENRGEILAVDIHPHKLALIEENCRRLGINIVKSLAMDAGRLPEQLREWADFILVDAPCTGLGVLRRRPDARWRKEPGQLPGIVRLQSGILKSAARCLKKNGVLVYSTCTITREENFGQIEDFLACQPDFIPEDLRPYLPVSLDEQGTMHSGYLEILPHRHGMDGFFISRMRKKG
ncbi:16S rRNA (cytosine(967)-C(5))-methyltransferase RsmB [Pelotomaculum isophthalicicum JI]|uniref:16S rRNA (cytosine(967)-C(5))-methyltransferase n=1 Tax=Pelotomaculum isophthalicicum JI TaxID=947010 RepID=A0A9X4JVY0_9FIRM|nr:16S rRNA (cytosine(967)-C(5))-methyltransferase RsmB [Pelotomaculum isophthalicicum]MDF9408158.1 16S rRNA (cytosine(967)-C(5))-methyltransferase RsmB [Pelotomaculum isophthalicicum JI]